MNMRKSHTKSGSEGNRFYFRRRGRNSPYSI